MEYIRSTELYKGFLLTNKAYTLGNNLNYHKIIIVTDASTGKSVSWCKTKKEAKDLIDGGYIQMFIRKE